MKLRSYQQDLYKQVLDMPGPVRMIAANTGAGKTELAVHLIKENPQARFLILPHGQKVLRENFSARLKLRGVDCRVVHSARDLIGVDQERVVVSLPHTVYKHLNNLSKFDWIVVDEAHEFYQRKGKMYQAILDWHGEGQQLLLSATHWKLGADKAYYSREQGLLAGSSVDAEVRLHRVSTRLKESDHNKDGDLKDKVKPFVGSPGKAVEDLVVKGVPTMLAFHNVEYAEKAFKYLKRKGHKIGLDVGAIKSDDLARFKAGNLDACVVVYKGILGYDFPGMRCFIDATFTQNVSRMYQQVGRLDRPLGDTDKIYHKLVPEQDEPIYRLIMTAVVGLSADDQYREWDGEQSTVKTTAPKRELDPENFVRIDGEVLGKVLHDDGSVTLVDEDGKTVHEIPADSASNNGSIREYVTGSSPTERVPGQKKPSVANDFAIRFSELQEMWRDADGYVTCNLRDAIRESRLMRGEGCQQWDYDKCLAEAAKYSSLNEWRTKHPNSYAAALRLGIQRDIARELGWKGNRQWTDGDIRTEAAKYSSLNEWRTKHPNSYAAALKLGIQRDIARELGWGVREKWSDEDIRTEAAKYSSLREWQTKHPNSYQAALKLGIQRDIAQELGWQVQEKRQWTDEDIRTEAAKYNSLREWKTKHPNSYAAALRLGIQRDIARELGWQVRGS